MDRLSRLRDGALVSRRDPQVGDILACGWGYEQTRIDFYQVIRATKTQIKIAAIDKVYVTCGGGPGNATVMPVPGKSTLAKPLTRRFEYSTETQFLECAGPRAELSYGQPLVSITTQSDRTYHCKIKSYSTAKLWDGSACNESGEY